MSKTRNTKRGAPGRTPESREQQVIAAAYDLAEQQILDGTASSQVITHFLKLATQREALEREILKENAKLLKAKTDAIASNEQMEKVYREALDAMREYSGNQTDDEDYYDD